MNLAALPPQLRDAAERFERETGRRLDDNLPAGPVDERMLELFLIMQGYSPDKDLSDRCPAQGEELGNA